MTGYLRIKRMLDIILGIISAIVFALPMLIIGILIKITSKGPVIHHSMRVGINNSQFVMAKFRTMRIDTPVQDINTLLNPENYYVPFGSFLRKTGLDELPQIFNVIKGEMSFVGPRPVLFNHVDVTTLRTQKGIHKILPGITGIAQIRAENHINAIDRVRYDEIYLNNTTFSLDIKILIQTFVHLIKKIAS